MKCITRCLILTRLQIKDSRKVGAAGVGQHERDQSLAYTIRFQNRTRLQYREDFLYLSHDRSA